MWASKIWGYKAIALCIVFKRGTTLSVVHESTLTPCSVYLQIAQRFLHYLKNNDLQQRLVYPKTCTMTLRALSYRDWDS